MLVALYTIYHYFCDNSILFLYSFYMNSIYIYIPIYLITIVTILISYYTGRANLTLSMVLLLIIISFSFIGSAISIFKRHMTDKKNKKNQWSRTHVMSVPSLSQAVLSLSQAVPSKNNINNHNP